jgi:hypothetical protein
VQVVVVANVAQYLRATTIHTKYRVRAVLTPVF